MDLENSTEPLRQIAVIVTAVLIAVGAALTSLAASVDWTWIAPASTAVTAAIGILTHLFATKKGRAVVTPGPNVAALLAMSEPVVEPADIDTSAALTNPADAHDSTDALDTAAREAGLT